MPVKTRVRWQVGTGTAPGTCGELAQGVLPNGRPFHVTCPIDRFARIDVRLRRAATTTVAGLEPHLWKTERALSHAADFFELGCVEIEVDRASDLDLAKGQASSTADIVAAIRAVSRASNSRATNATIAELAASIEPTDGLMYPGIVVADHHTGEELNRWDWWPQFAIAMFNPSARRETSRGEALSAGASPGEFVDLLASLDRAVEARDPAAFAAQATRSASFNQTIAPNPLFPILRQRAPDNGADGLCVGHSGTVCGVLFSGDDALDRATAAVRELLPYLERGTRADVVSTPEASS